MPVVRSSKTCMRYMPQLRLPVSGLREEHQRQGDEAAAVFGPALQHRVIASEKPVVRTTSWHGPLETIFGKNAPISASFGSILSLPISPSGMRISRNSTMRAATLPPIHFQRDLHLAHAGEGVDQHRNVRSPWAFRTAAPDRRLHARSANSVISRIGSTSNGMRFSSWFFSSAR
jgi:hypothetical protein